MKHDSSLHIACVCDMEIAAGISRPRRVSYTVKPGQLASNVAVELCETAVVFQAQLAGPSQILVRVLQIG